MSEKSPFEWQPPTVQELTKEQYYGKVLQHFKDNVPPARLSKNLRNLIFHYQTFAADGHPFNMEDLLADTLGLFELLDKLETIQ